MKVEKNQMENLEREGLGSNLKISNFIVSLTGLKKLAKKLVHVQPSKEGNDMAFFLKMLLK